MLRDHSDQLLYCSEQCFQESIFFQKQLSNESAHFRSPNLLKMPVLLRNCISTSQYQQEGGEAASHDQLRVLEMVQELRVTRTDHNTSLPATATTTTATTIQSKPTSHYNYSSTTKRGKGPNTNSTINTYHHEKAATNAQPAFPISFDITITEKNTDDTTYPLLDSQSTQDLEMRPPSHHNDIEGYKYGHFGIDRKDSTSISSISWVNSGETVAFLCHLSYQVVDPSQSQKNTMRTMKRSPQGRTPEEKPKF